LCISLWKVVFQLQGRVLYSLLTSIWVNSINQSADQENDTAFVIILCTTGAFDFIFSLYLNTQFSYILPTPAFLSSKDNAIEVITLSHKFILQILALAFSPDSPSFLWTFISINISIDFMRNFWLLKSLPLYQIKALKYQGCLLAVISSLNLSCLTTMIAKSADEDSSSLTLLLLLWVILSFFTVKILMNYLNHTHWRLLSNPSITNPALLIHRIVLF